MLVENVLWQGDSHLLFAEGGVLGMEGELGLVEGKMDPQQPIVITNFLLLVECHHTLGNAHGLGDIVSIDLQVDFLGF